MLLILIITWVYKKKFLILPDQQFGPDLYLNISPEIVWSTQVKAIGNWTNKDALKTTIKPFLPTQQNKGLPRVKRDSPNVKVIRIIVASGFAQNDLGEMYNYNQRAANLIDWVIPIDLLKTFEFLVIQNHLRISPW